MATTNGTYTDLAGTNPDFAKSALLLLWLAVPNGNQGSALRVTGYSDKSIQVDGTFGASGSVQLEGSNDNSSWFILRDPLGANLTFTAAGLKQVLENVRFVRPNVTAGDGSTALNIRVLATVSARG